MESLMSLSCFNINKCQSLHRNLHFEVAFIFASLEEGCNTLAIRHNIVTDILMLDSSQRMAVPYC